MDDNLKKYGIIGGAIILLCVFVFGGLALFRKTDKKSVRVVNRAETL